jgi:hypothetical protein
MLVSLTGLFLLILYQVNGSACSQNSKLLNDLLKDELGFQGFVMSDWSAQIGGVSSALAGLDMAMPGDGAVPLLGDSFWNYELSRSILNGTVPVERLNDMVGYHPSGGHSLRRRTLTSMSAEIGDSNCCHLVQDGPG